jgi:hypothetical protein
MQPTLPYFCCGNNSSCMRRCSTRQSINTQCLPVHSNIPPDQSDPQLMHDTQSECGLGDVGALPPPTKQPRIYITKHTQRPKAISATTLCLNRSLSVAVGQAKRSVNGQTGQHKQGIYDKKYHRECNTDLLILYILTIYICFTLHEGRNAPP